MSTKGDGAKTDNDAAAGEYAASAVRVADVRLFRAVADYTYDWESWHGTDGRLLWVNPAVERVTGYSVAECLAMDNYPLPMIAPEDRDRMGNVLAEAHNQTSGEHVEFRSLHRRDESRWMSLCWQPMYDGPGNCLGFRTSIRDVTERRALRDQLRLHAEHLEQLVQERTLRLRQLEQRQERMEKLAALGQLAAAVAHEINNPLAGMRNAFQLFKSSLSPEHEHFDLLDLIDHEIERISVVIQQMYQLYRRSPQQSSEFAIEQIVGQVACLLENEGRKREVALKWEPPPGPVLVSLAEGEVKQIVYNLIRNAIQASPPGEEVAISVTHNDLVVAVHVKDNGAGIPIEDVARIFDPFFSTKQGGSQSGMGLGLSVSRSLIEAMGGRFDVASGLGSGSVFTAIFPRRVDAPQDCSDA